jgi:hypothetical protein
MNTSQTNIDAIKDIRTIMERSSRFISLSGWSGISAGIFALAGAWVANDRIKEYYSNGYSAASACPSCLRNELSMIAAIVFFTAFISAFLFTYAKTKKEGVPIWGSAAKRLLWNTLLPMVTGGILIWKMIDLKQYDFVVSSTLIFYGLALVNGSKYTMGEVRYLGYAEIVTGIVSLLIIPKGLYAWAFGFGVLHIIYGIAMWWKYDRNS